MTNSNLVLFRIEDRILAEAAASEPSTISRLLQLAWNALHARDAIPPLALDTMPDYLKRDIGFLDGRGPRQGS
ncbi:hypothetical protein [Rhizobium sp. RAF56]|jgi:hypothetical protein|uniref:hypothetical protein n=1 Tax=Rhizobium sp. RAF56 TaxID=3233062 RepID=UPI003F9B2794